MSAVNVADAGERGGGARQEWKRPPDWLGVADNPGPHRPAWFVGFLDRVAAALKPFASFGRATSHLSDRGVQVLAAA
jgi:hypothetical protein